MLFFFLNCRRHLLRASSGIDELGSVQWPLIVCLGVSWFTCFMCLFRGIKSLGKVTQEFVVILKSPMVD